MNTKEKDKLKSFLINTYGKNWDNLRYDKHKVLEFDKQIIAKLKSYCEKYKKCKVFEVCIGNGYPIAAALSANGYHVGGIDISKFLIDNLNKNYPNVKSYIGDALEMDEIINEKYDIIYCVHSLFFFKEPSLLIKQMNNVLKPGGIIMLDIYNSSNAENLQSARVEYFFNKNIFGKVIKFIKNLVKVILRTGTVEFEYVFKFFLQDLNKVFNQLKLIEYYDIELNVLVDGGFQKIDIKNKNEITKYKRIVLCAKKS